MTRRGWTEEIAEHNRAWQKRYGTKFLSKWDEHRETIERMLSEGASFSEIAKRLGTTRNAVGGYVRRSGLSVARA